MEAEDPVIHLAVRDRRELPSSGVGVEQVPELALRVSVLKQYFPVIYNQTFGREPSTRHITLLAYAIRGFRFSHLRRLISVAERYDEAEHEGRVLDPADWYDDDDDPQYSLAYASTLHSELIPLLRTAQHYGFEQAHIVLSQLVTRHYAAQHHWDRIVIALPWRDDFDTNRDWLHNTPDSFYDTAYAPYVGELRTINAELNGLDAALRFTIMRDYMARRLGKSGRLCTGGSVSRPTFVLGNQRIYRVKYGNRSYDPVPEAWVYEATGAGDPERDLILPAHDARIVSLCGDSKFYSLLLTPGGGEAALESDYYTLLSNVGDKTRNARNELRVTPVSRELITAETTHYTVTANPNSGLTALAHDPQLRHDLSEWHTQDVRTMSACDSMVILMNDAEDTDNVRFTGVDFAQFTDVPIARLKHQAVLVGCGRRYVAYVDLKGRLYIVGTLDDGKGEFGTTSIDKAPVFTKFTRIEHEGRITMLSCGANHLMVVDAAGLWVMGRNDAGQLAANWPSSRGTGAELKRIPTQGAVIDIACGDHCSLVQTTTGVYYSSYVTRRLHLATEYPVAVTKAEYSALLKETETVKPKKPKKPKKKKQMSSRATGDTKKREASEEEVVATAADESEQPRTKKSRLEERENGSDGDTNTTPIILSSCHWCGDDIDGDEPLHKLSASLLFCDTECQGHFDASIVTVVV